MIRVNLKFGVNPNSERKVEKNVATELKQDLQITVFRATKRAVTYRRYHEDSLIRVLFGRIFSTVKVSR